MIILIVYSITLPRTVKIIAVHCTYNDNYNLDGILNWIIGSVINSFRVINSLQTIGEDKMKLTVPEQHQLKIARDTLKLSDIGALILGGPTKEQAKEIIIRLTRKGLK